MDYQEITRMSKKIGRNEPCPCGSGKKYKHCCLGKKAAAKNLTISKSEKPVPSPLAIKRFEQKLQKNPQQLEQIGKELEKYSGDREISFKEFILKVGILIK
jgi:hypothetical protein